jgi:DNA-binding response OmpR family regulator
MAPILIISDSPNLRTSLARILQHAGYPAHAASPGELPRLLNKQPFELLIFELRMPYESGLKLLNSVRSLYRLSIIVLSSATYPLVKKRALMHGATEFLLKPVDPERIIDCVQQTISRPVAVNPPSPVPTQHLNQSYLDTSISSQQS